MKTFKKLFFTLNNSEEMKIKSKTPTFNFLTKFYDLNSQKKSKNFFDVINTGSDISIKKIYFTF